MTGMRRQTALDENTELCEVEADDVVETKRSYERARWASVGCVTGGRTPVGG
jgi:hypothetical protein